MRRALAWGKTNSPVAKPLINDAPQSAALRSRAAPPARNWQLLSYNPAVDGATELRNRSAGS